MKKQNDLWGGVTLSLLGIAAFIGAWYNNLLLVITGIIGIIWFLHLELNEDIEKLEETIKKLERKK